MMLTKEELLIQKEALDYIQKNKSELINHFILNNEILQLDLVTIFMAGSPGAGKTEFSKNYLPSITKKFFEPKLIKKLNLLNIDIENMNDFLVRIDVDEIREFLPQYCKTENVANQKGNAEVVHKAATKGLDIIRDYCLRNEISFLHDGTFSNYNTMKKIIKKSLQLERKVMIFFLYMNPLKAWEFTKAREYIEGRNIIKENFIKQFFSSRENVDRVKQDFGNRVEIHGVLKDNENKVELIKFNIESVNSFLESQYRQGRQTEYSEEDLLNLLN